MQLNQLERKTKIILKKFLEKEEYQKVISELKFFLIKNEELGDYSTNLLFLIDKIAPSKKDLILNEIKKKFKVFFDPIEIKNNYLNFYLSKNIILKDIRKIIKNKEKFFRVDYGRKRKVIVEYVSANPTGPLHMGNIRAAILGDILVEFLKLANFKVFKEYYVNDRGNQIEVLGKSILAALEKIPWEENFYKGDYVKIIADLIKNKIEKIDDPQKIGKLAADLILEKIIKPSLKELETTFDFYFFESDLYKNKNLVDKVLNIYKKKGLIEKQEKAIVLKLTKIGEIKDEYLIKSNGEPTYFFSDILYHYNKFFIRKFKIAINFLGADHLDHARRLKAALKILTIKDFQLKFIIYQHVLLKKEEEFLKMSKRRGTFISLNDLLELINPGVIRFMFANITPESTLGFDLELAQKQSEENPYWYCQYAYARLNSILEKVKELNLKIPSKIDPQIIAQKFIEDEIVINIFRDLHKFKDLILIISQELKPNLFYEFLLNFAKKIHQLYETKRIIKEETDKRDIYLIKNLRDLLGFFFSIMKIKPMERI